MNGKYLSVLCLIGVLSSCKTSNPGPVAQALESMEPETSNTQDRALGTLPASVSQALLPQMNDGNDELLGESRYDINAKQVDAVSFFSGLVQDTPYSVAIHPQVTGNISLDLKQVTLTQVFDLVSELYGYDIQRSEQVYRVYPAGLRTETIAVNYLLMQRLGITQTSIISGGVSQDGNNGQNGQNGVNNQNGLNNFSGNNTNQNNLGGGNVNNMVNGTNIATRTESDFWSDLQDTLQDMIGTADGRKVTVMSQAGLVSVRGMPEDIRTVKTFLKASEQISQRQVVLEARILEVSLSDQYQQGINWTDIVATSGNTSFSLSTSAGNFGNGITAAIGGVTSLSFLNEDFTGVLSLLSTQGNVQVLSSPRVTATNNQKAVIKVGDDEYFVTEVSNQNTITAGATTVAPNIELTPFFSGIALDVTPQIDNDGSVLLHIHPSVIETEEQEKVITVNAERFVLPLAQSNIRESDTVIRAKSGEIVVIGGLMQSIQTEQVSKTPLLGDIPFLGELFTSRNNIETKKELVILLKPTVVGADTWKQQLKRNRDTLADWLYVD